MHLKSQIEEMLKAGKLSHLIKELMQNSGKNQANVAKKGEVAGKDKPLAILMVQTGQKIAKQRITQTFSPETMISFPPLGEEDGIEGPMVIEAEVGGHLVHRMYVDGGTSSEILRRRTLNFRMEELSGCKIAFSVQNEYRRPGGPRTQQPVVDQGIEEKIQVAIHPEYPKQTIAIGSTLTEEGRKKLCDLLRQNLNIFAWKPSRIYSGFPLS
ncbi:hypothetical protein Tco_0573757 [Tanacetum coccineum]